jgi:hypothetical protein
MIVIRSTWLQWLDCIRHSRWLKEGVHWSRQERYQTKEMPPLMKRCRQRWCFKHCCLPHRFSFCWTSKRGTWCWQLFSFFLFFSLFSLIICQAIVWWPVSFCWADPLLAFSHSAGAWRANTCITRYLSLLNPKKNHDNASYSSEIKNIILMIVIAMTLDEVFLKISISINYWDCNSKISSKREQQSCTFVQTCSAFDWIR